MADGKLVSAADRCSRAPRTTPTCSIRLRVNGRLKGHPPQLARSEGNIRTPPDCSGSAYRRCTTCSRLMTCRPDWRLGLLRCSLAVVPLAAATAPARLSRRRTRPTGRRHCGRGRGGPRARCRFSRASRSPPTPVRPSCRKATSSTRSVARLTFYRVRAARVLALAKLEILEDNTAAAAHALTSRSRKRSANARPWVDIYRFLCQRPALSGGGRYRARARDRFWRRAPRISRSAVARREGARQRRLVRRAREGARRSRAARDPPRLWARPARTAGCSTLRGTWSNPTRATRAPTSSRLCLRARAGQYDSRDGCRGAPSAPTTRCPPGSCSPILSCAPAPGARGRAVDALARVSPTTRVRLLLVALLLADGEARLSRAWGVAAARSDARPIC